MNIDNCTNCMYSKYTETNILINDLTESNNMTCEHKNSSFYDELVNENKSCRLFLDYNKYFLKQDRKEKINNLKRK